MPWIKKGLIFSPGKENKLMHSHAAVPSAMILPDENIRIYFSYRNEKNQSMPAFIDVAGSNPSKMIAVHEEPLLSLGKTGAFDDSGIMPCSAVENNGKIYLYYTGWNAGTAIPYHNSIGLAISGDGGKKFQKASDGPVMDRTVIEPYLAITPFVHYENNKWQMWYASGTGNISVNDKPEPLYVIKYASSENGIDWKRENVTCIHPKSEFEANARPTVIKEDNVYKMWFSFRGSFDYRDGKDSYRIGYAESGNGINWKRMDESAGIDRSAEGWDSKMVTYPFVLPFKGKKYLFYNGNGFGRTGIGYAEWKD